MPKKKSPKDNLPHIPSLESLLSQFSGTGLGARSKRDGKHEAQELIYDAWENPNRKRRIELAHRALEMDPDCADAYVLLAQETAETAKEARDLYANGVTAGERSLGRKTFKQDAGHFWGILETRPYMRARSGLAQSLWELGERESAVEHYWEMLRLNPNDNQGIRDLLAPCLLEMNRDEDLERLLKMYAEDGSAFWTYTLALSAFRRTRDTDLSRKRLQNAVKTNPHIPKYLLGEKRLPKSLPEFYSPGKESEAVIYVHGNQAAWKETAGALEWLAKSS